MYISILQGPQLHTSNSLSALSCQRLHTGNHVTAGSSAVFALLSSQWLYQYTCLWMGSGRMQHGPKICCHDMTLVLGISPNPGTFWSWAVPGMSVPGHKSCLCDCARQVLVAEQKLQLGIPDITTLSTHKVSQVVTTRDALVADQIRS